LIEGGIAGTINLRTRLPLDQKGHLLTFAASGAYGSLSKEFSPSFSGVISNQWETPIGDIGLLLDASYSKLKTQSDRWDVGEYIPFAPSVFGTSSTAFVQGDSHFTDTDYVRERLGISAAAQWRDVTGRMLVTLRYNRSDYESDLREESVFRRVPQVGSAAEIITDANRFGALPGTSPLVFNSDGVFQSGSTSEGFGFYGFLNNDQGLSQACYPWQTTTADPASPPCPGGRVPHELATSQS
jgi:iron complex outermembrane recepter protein